MKHKLSDITRRCSRCKMTRPMLEFYRGKDGRQAVCKECRTLQARAWNVARKRMLDERKRQRDADNARNE